MGMRTGLGEKRRRELETELARSLEAIVALGAERVILFGSLATGNVGKASDIDLIIVKETDKRFLDRADEFYLAIDPTKAMDILVYTPQEFEAMQATSSFIRRAVPEGRVLYEARPKS